jgi:plasmid stabilization system protein ParE
MSRDSMEVANEVEGRLFAAFESLARMPRQGHRRRDLTSKPLLFFPVYSYLIILQ